MANCVSIRLQEVFDYIPEKYVEGDGYVYLDLKPDFDLRETKQLTELNEEGKLTFTFQLGFDLPWTEKNFAVLKKFLHSNHTDNDRKQINVDVVNGSHVTSENQLYVTKGKLGRIDAQLKLSLNHWALKSANLKLKEIQQEDFEFSIANLTDVIENQKLYDKDNAGVWLPYFDYGTIIRDHSITGRTFNFVAQIYQMRPWFHVSGILRNGFCNVGWNFISPLFDSTYGKSLITYLLDRNYGISDPRVPLLNARASVQENYIVGFQFLGGRGDRVAFPESEEDNGGNLSDFNAIYSGVGEVNVKGRVRITVAKKGTTITLRYGNLTKTTVTGGNSMGTSPLIDSFEATTSEDDEDIAWNFEAANIPIGDLDRYGVFIQKQPADSLVAVRNNKDDDGNVIQGEEGSYIQYTGVRKYWEKGDVVNLADMIDPEWLFLDFVKGITHLLNLKWYTNFRTLEVLALQPYEVELMGEVLESFFIEDSVENLIAKIDPKTVQTTSPQVDQERRILLSYKDSTDEYVKNMNFANSLYSHTEDLGEKFTVDKTKELPNPFFEATAEGALSNTRLPGLTLSISKMRDGSRYGWNYGPRVVLAHGYRKIRLSDTGGIPFSGLGGGGTPGLRLFDWGADSKKLIPLASSFVRHEVAETENDENAEDFILITDNVAFGLNPELGDYDTVKTLYWHVYRRWLKEQLNNMTIQYLVSLTNVDFRALDFRSYYLIEHLGRLVKVRINSVNDFHYCGTISTPVDFIPEIQVSDLCGLVTGTPGDGDGPRPCANYPIVLCSDDGASCFTFSIGGSNSAIIDSITWQVREQTSIGFTNWQNVATALTYTKCNSERSFEVRAIVSYEEDQGQFCEAITTNEKFVNACPYIDWSILCFDVLQPPNPTLFKKAKVEWAGEDIDEDQISILSFEWSQIGEPFANWVPYNNEAIHPSDLGTGLFRATVQYASCPPVDIITVWVATALNFRVQYQAV